MMDIKDNKFLTVASGVILTPIITPVIVGMDKYFEKANLHAVVTSGLRDAYKQLAIIQKELVIKGLDSKYPEALTCKPQDMLNGNYTWQYAWSNLLNIGFIVNPPLAAKVLMDYFGPTGAGPNRKGSIINQTPHANGTAFNIGGGGNGVADEAAVVQTALYNKLSGLVDFLVERNNNAIHCDCKTII